MTNMTKDDWKQTLMVGDVSDNPDIRIKNLKKSVKVVFNKKLSINYTGIAWDANNPNDKLNSTLSQSIANGDIKAAQFADSSTPLTGIKVFRNYSKSIAGNWKSICENNLLEAPMQNEKFKNFTFNGLQQATITYEKPRKIKRTDMFKRTRSTSDMSRASVTDEKPVLQRTKSTGALGSKNKTPLRPGFHIPVYESVGEGMRATRTGGLQQATITYEKPRKIKRTDMFKRTRSTSDMSRASVTDEKPVLQRTKSTGALGSKNKTPLRPGFHIPVYESVGEGMRGHYVLEDNTPLDIEFKPHYKELTPDVLEDNTPLDIEFKPHYGEYPHSEGDPPPVGPPPTSWVKPRPLSMSPQQQPVAGAQTQGDRARKRYSAPPTMAPPPSVPPPSTPAPGKPPKDDIPPSSK